MKLFIPLAKVDEAQRIVVGRAVQEVPDKSGEILDYATAKPAFQAWSDQISHLSGGLSKGNVRVQHDPKSAVGKVIDMTFDDDAKAIDVCVKVVDPAAWEKVKEGVYTGFSVGGSYGAKWTDPETGLRKYTPKVTELSLVDNPCIPTASITLFKADGSQAQIRPRPISFLEALDEAAGPAPAPSFALELAKAERERGGASAGAALGMGALGAAAGAVGSTGRRVRDLYEHDTRRIGAGAAYRLLRTNSIRPGPRAAVYRAALEANEQSSVRMTSAAAREGAMRFAHIMPARRALGAGAAVGAGAYLAGSALFGKAMRAAALTKRELSEAEHQQRVDAARARWRDRQASIEEARRPENRGRRYEAAMEYRDRRTGQIFERSLGAYDDQGEAFTVAAHENLADMMRQRGWDDDDAFRGQQEKYRHSARIGGAIIPGVAGTVIGGGLGAVIGHRRPALAAGLGAAGALLGGTLGARAGAAAGDARGRERNRSSEVSRAELLGKAGRSDAYQAMKAKIAGKAGG